MMKCSASVGGDCFGIKKPRNDDRKGIRSEYEGNALLIVEEIALRLFKSLAITSEIFSFGYDTLQLNARSLILKVDEIDINIYTIDNSHFHVM